MNPKVLDMVMTRLLCSPYYPITTPGPPTSGGNDAWFGTLS